MPYCVIMQVHDTSLSLSINLQLPQSLQQTGKEVDYYPERELKQYVYIVSLQEKIVRACTDDPLPKRRVRGLKPDDPRNIAPTLAAVPAPPTADLVARHQTRFGKKKYA